LRTSIFFVPPIHKKLTCLHDSESVFELVYDFVGLLFKTLSPQFALSQQDLVAFFDVAL